MPKTRSLEADEQTLTKKVRDRAASLEGERNADPALRALRKRLRRAQRKRRTLARRQRQAAPKGAEGGETAA